MINNDLLDDNFTSTNLLSQFAQVNVCKNVIKHILIITFLLLKYYVLRCDIDLWSFDLEHFSVCDQTVYQILVKLTIPRTAA